MEIPFNFGKEIKKMSIENKDRNNNELEEEEEEEEGEQETKEEEEWSYSYYGYEYKTMVPAEKRSGPILAIRIQTHIHKEKLDIIEKIIRLRYGTGSHTFREYIDEALVSQVEKDLQSSETIAKDFCKNMLQKWNNEISEEVKKMRERKQSATGLLINKAGEEPWGW